MNFSNTFVETDSLCQDSFVYGTATHHSNLHGENLYGQVVNYLILKIKDIVIFAVILTNAFLET